MGDLKRNKGDPEPLENKMMILLERMKDLETDNASNQESIFVLDSTIKKLQDFNQIEMQEYYIKSRQNRHFCCQRKSERQTRQQTTNNSWQVFIFTL